MKSATGLYPIIRRVRRPLMPVEVVSQVQKSDTKTAVAETDQNPAKSEKAEPGVIEASENVTQKSS